MKKFIPLLSLFLFCSCADVVYTETLKDFKGDLWAKNDANAFEFEVSEAVPSADVIVKFSHVYEPGYKTLPLKITIKHPDVTQDILDTTLKLTDESGDNIGECAGDICDLKQLVADNISLKQGIYTIILEHGYEKDVLPGVLAVGLVVEKASE